MFFVIFANPIGAVVDPVEASVPSDTFGQMAGVTTHAEIVSSVVSVRK
jgi:hypothetical protein